VDRGGPHARHTEAPAAERMGVKAYANTAHVFSVG
jgi:hypothetical protein